MLLILEMWLTISVLSSVCISSFAVSVPFRDSFPYSPSVGRGRVDHSKREVSSQSLAEICKDTPDVMFVLCLAAVGTVGTLEEIDMGRDAIGTLITISKENDALPGQLAGDMLSWIHKRTNKADQFHPANALEYLAKASILEPNAESNVIWEALKGRVGERSDAKNMEAFDVRIEPLDGGLTEAQLAVIARYSITHTDQLPAICDALSSLPHYHNWQIDFINDYGMMASTGLGKRKRSIAKALRRSNHKGMKVLARIIKHNPQHEPNFYEAFTIDQRIAIVEYTKTHQKQHWRIWEALSSLYKEKIVFRWELEYIVGAIGKVTNTNNYVAALFLSGILEKQTDRMDDLASKLLDGMPLANEYLVELVEYARATESPGRTMSTVRAAVVALSGDSRAKEIQAMHQLSGRERAWTT